MDNKNKQLDVDGAELVPNQSLAGEEGEGSQAAPGPPQEPSEIPGNTPMKRTRVVVCRRGSRDLDASRSPLKERPDGVTEVNEECPPGKSLTNQEPQEGEEGEPTDREGRERKG